MNMKENITDQMACLLSDYSITKFLEVQEREKLMGCRVTEEILVKIF